MFVNTCFSYPKGERRCCSMMKIDKRALHTEIGLRIRAARDSAGLTQEALAESLDCTAQYISDLERGVTGISVPMLRLLCLKLGISSDSILFAGMPERDYLSLEEKCRSLTDEQYRLLAEIIGKYVEAVHLP